MTFFLIYDALHDSVPEKMRTSANEKKTTKQNTKTFQAFQYQFVLISRKRPNTSGVLVGININSTSYRPGAEQLPDKVSEFSGLKRF